MISAGWYNTENKDARNVLAFGRMIKTLGGVSMSKSISGIYAIVNKITGKKYIGSAVNLQHRWAVHRHELRKGIHHSVVLQRAYNKYGEDNLEYSILEYCAPDELIEIEQKYIDINKPEYNILPTAGSMLGFKHSLETKIKIAISSLGRKHSEESKKKISEAQIGEKNHAWGTKHTEEEKQKISNSCKGKTAYWTGKKHSEESNKKRSETMKAYRAKIREND